MEDQEKKLEEFRQFYKEKVPQRVMQFMKKFEDDNKPSEEECYEFTSFIASKDQNWVDFAHFCGSFPRQGFLFEGVRYIHIWGIKNDKKYHHLYDISTKSSRDAKWEKLFKFRFQDFETLMTDKMLFSGDF